MKICFLANGLSIHAQKWVNFFAKDHDVSLITFHGARNINKNVKVYHEKVIPVGTHDEVIVPDSKIKFASALIKFVRKTKKLIKEINPDILHAHSITHYGLTGALTGKKPFVVTAWGSDVLIRPKKSFLFKIAAKYTLKKADIITCDAEHVKKAMIKLNAKEDKIHIIMFGIDVEKFRPERKNKADLIPRGYQSVISLRNMDPIYNVETLIKSAPLIIEKLPKTKFIIIGRGSQDYLKKLAKNLGVEEHIIFAGTVPNDEIPRYLNSSDVYVSTSLSDAGLASSTAEAMACGLPVVITDFGDNKKWVKDGWNGFIFPPKNHKVLAERIIHLLKDKKLREEFGKNGRKIIVEKINYKKEMEKMENIYKVLALK